MRSGFFRLAEHEGFLVTAFHLDDDLVRLVGQAAAAQGKTVDEFVAETLRDTLSQPESMRRGVRSGVPVAIVPDETARIDPRNVRRHLEEEGF